ncbi:MAG: hypothetical protein AAF902_12265 [Chloroflexota bacterium]
MFKKIKKKITRTVLAVAVALLLAGAPSVISTVSAAGGSGTGTVGSGGG